MNIQDRKKSFTAEELRRRYNLDGLDQDRKALQLMKDTLNHVEVQFQRFIDIINRSLKEYPSQADGNITAWFFNGIPSEIQPVFDIEEEHLGDLYYDREAGKSYEFKLIEGEYEWEEITDKKINEVLSIESSSADTSDNKRVVFIAQPETPYSIGDIWINDGKYYRCRSRKIGSYVINGTTIQDGTPTSNEPIDVINKTGLITETIEDNDYRFDLGNIELCKIDTYQDKIYYDNGKWYLHKEIGKVMLNGSEVISLAADDFQSVYRFAINNVINSKHSGQVYSNRFAWYADQANNTSFNNSEKDNEAINVRDDTRGIAIKISKNLVSSVNTFKTWLLNNNVVVYYILSTPTDEEITDEYLLSQLSIGSFNISDWIIYTDYSDDIVVLDTTAELNQLKKEVKENYVSNATLETTANSINARVDGNYTYITQVETTAENNKTATDQQIQEIRNTVEANQTSTAYEIQIINQQLVNGVVKFDTGTGYTFDIEGLKINKADSIMRLILDNNGLVVYRNNDEVLRADSDGVNAENMTVRKFYVQKPIRVEKTKAISDPTKVGWGLFWVGE